jgi:hypothetical protein
MNSPSNQMVIGVWTLLKSDSTRGGGAHHVTSVGLMAIDDDPSRLNGAVKGIFNRARFVEKLYFQAT